MSIKVAVKHQSSSVMLAGIYFRGLLNANQFAMFRLKFGVEAPGCGQFFFRGFHVLAVIFSNPLDENAFNFNLIGSLKSRIFFIFLDILLLYRVL